MTLHLATLAALLFTSVFPQTVPQATVEFEAATIKPAQPGAPGAARYSGGSCHGVDKQYAPDSLIPAPPQGRCVFRNVGLTSLLSISFKTATAGGPSWASDMYDVDAKAEDVANVTEAQLLAMLQNLVVSRFQVKSHREQREVPSFVLTVAKNGPRNLKEVSSDERPMVRFGPGPTVTARNATMSYLANSIGGMAHGPVTDKTGLTAKYNFSFEWPSGEPDAFLSEMQAQLGLRVEQTKLTREFLVIDQAEKPQQD